ncbi:MAG TPA: MarR family transcriptional regulator [Candidatus Saccharimonadales bacterium]|jgi:DNA-binding MarR family transcriptional regulator
MARQTILEKYQLAFVEFLLLAKRNIIEIGGRHGLTPMQLLALLALDEPRSMHELTSVFYCDPSNVTGIIDGLEHKNLAARSENPADRRIKMIGLKRKGTDIRSILVDELAGDDSYILAKLSKREAKTFINLVQKIVKD